MPELLGFLQAGEDPFTLMARYFALLLLPILLGAIWGIYRLTRRPRPEGRTAGGVPEGCRDFFVAVLMLIAFGIGACYLSIVANLWR